MYRIRDYLRSNMRTLKGAMIGFNILFFIEALILIIVGSAFLHTTMSKFAITSILSSLPTGIIIVGVFLLILSVVGVWGSVKEKKSWMRTFTMILVILIIAEFGIGYSALAAKDTAQDLLQQSWSGVYTSDPNAASILQIEKTFRCCGFSNTTDMAVPAQCADATVSLGYQNSCWSTIGTNFKASAVGVGVAAVLIALLQLAALVVSCCLMSRIPSESEKEGYLLEQHRRLTKAQRLGGARI